MAFAPQLVFFLQLISNFSHELTLAYSWRQPSLIEDVTIHILSSRQSRSLRTILLNSVLPFISSGIHCLTSSNIKTLRLGMASREEANRDFTSQLKMLAQTCHSLESLEIDHEIFALRGIYDRGPYHQRLEGLSFVEFDRFCQQRALHLELSARRLSLSSLKLSGCDLGDLFEGENLSCIEIPKLNSLSLRSCVKYNGMLRFLASLQSTPGVKFHLHKLDLRLRITSISSAEALSRLLSSFSGLAEIYLLLETPLKAQRITELLQSITEHHGSSLRNLIWDVRKGPRQTVKMDTSVLPEVDHEGYQNSHLRIICEKFPLLIELGICLDWDSYDECEWDDNEMKRVSLPDLVYLSELSFSI